MGEPSPQETAIRPDRLMALSDGVFAIVMTLLVFQLGVPVVTGNQALADEIAAMWPDFAVYVLSFLVLGVFWLIHHVLFDLIDRADTTMIWLNIAFLMVAALVPFSTSLVAEHGATTTTAVVYGANMILVFGVGWAIFAYATHRRRLVAADLDPEIVRGGLLMGVAYMVFMAPSTAAAIVSPVVSFVLYAVLILAIIATTMVGRGEVVLLWPAPKRPAAPAEESAPPRPLVRS